MDSPEPATLPTIKDTRGNYHLLVGSGGENFFIDRIDNSIYSIQQNVVLFLVEAKLQVPPGRRLPAGKLETIQYN